MGWTVKDYSSLFGAKEKNIYDVRVRLKVFLCYLSGKELCK